MTLFYVKPMVSLEFGLIFASFARKLSSFSLADENLDLLRINKLNIFITDKDGFIHGMTENSCKAMGLPPPSVG
jgi:hypothetical protein